MEYRLLGRTGVWVSPYSLGTMMFGKNGNKDENECIKIVHSALDAGMNMIDTADEYGEGQAEEIIGKAIQGRRTERRVWIEWILEKSNWWLRDSLSLSLKQRNRHCWMVW